MFARCAALGEVRILERGHAVRRATRLLIAGAVATFTVVYALWAPFSPDGVNEMIRAEPEIVPVAAACWLFQFCLVLFLIRWIEESA